jgi:hypothetical protein
MFAVRRALRACRRSGSRVFAILGDRAATLVWLARALDERDPWSISLAVDPVFAPLRGEPAFARLLGRLGLPCAPSTRNAQSRIRTVGCADVSSSVEELQSVAHELARIL